MSAALRCAGLGHRYGRRLLTAGDTASSRWSWFSSVNLVPASEAVLALAAAALATGWHATRTRAV